MGIQNLVADCRLHGAMHLITPHGDSEPICPTSGTDSYPAHNPSWGFGTRVQRGGKKHYYNS